MWFGAMAIIGSGGSKSSDAQSQSPHFSPRQMLPLRYSLPAMQNCTGERIKTWNFGVECTWGGSGVIVGEVVGRRVGVSVDCRVGVEFGVILVEKLQAVNAAIMQI